MLSGVSWLIGNLVVLLEPALTERFLIMVGVAALGEILLTIWLLLRGVDVEKWQAAARNSAVTI
jgi:hypothetical protein